MTNTYQNLFNQAKTFADQKNYSKAANCFQQIVRLDSSRIDALINSGLMYYYNGQYDRAEQCMLRALSKIPDSSDIYYNLGLIYNASNQKEQSIDCYKKALTCDSKNVLAWYNLGDLYFQQKQYKTAIHCFQKTISLEKYFSDAHLNMGESYSRLENYEQAIDCFKHLLSIEPQNIDAYYNLGVAYNALRQYKRAISAYDQALAINSNHIKSHYNKSFILLLLGDFDNGFLEYEWRIKKSETYRSSSQKPFWNGAKIKDDTLLVYAEQGFGDCIQFIRFLPMIRKKVKTIVLECQKELIRLFTDIQCIDIIVQRDKPLPDHHYQVSLLSLGHLLKITQKQLPGTIPYLKQSFSVPKYLSDIIAAHRKQLNVGFVWGGTGSTIMRTDMGRSLLLKECETFFGMNNVQWFSFQKGPRAKELNDSPGNQLIDLGKHCSDFADTAIAACQMDLIITVDTAMAHLAGALGLKVLTLLSFDADWRWLQKIDYSPWYPTMKLFRQDKPGSWKNVLLRVKHEIFKQLNLKDINNKTEKPITILKKENELMTQHKDASFQEAVQHFQQNRLEAAKDSILPLLKKNPDNSELWHFFGIIAAREKHIQLAIHCMNKACALSPEKGLFYFNLANAYRQGKFFNQSIKTYQKALKRSPNDQSIAINYGITLKEKGRYEEALKIFQQILDRNPEHIQSYINMGNIFSEMGLYTSAMAYYEKALHIKPDDEEAHRNRALLLMVQEDLKNGFEAYEWRWVNNGVRIKRNLTQKEWDGSDLQDRHIFVWGEQGLGDEIFFASMFPELIQKARQVSIECAPRLLPLFVRSFPQAIVIPGIQIPEQEPDLFPEADYHCPSGGLLRFLRSSQKSFPKHDGYLKADENKVKMIRERYLPETNQLKVGISWTSAIDYDQPAQLELWKPVLSCPNVRFFNLQYGDCLEELNRIQEELKITIYNDPDIDPLKNIDDQAAQIQVMDLVISIGSTTAQLAGALGKNIWVILPVSSDWHWFSNRNDSPWFPSMKFFRQNRLGDWNSVLQNVSKALQQLTQQHSRKG